MLFNLFNYNHNLFNQIKAVEDKKHENKPQIY